MKHLFCDRAGSPIDLSFLRIIVKIKNFVPALLAEGEVMVGQINSRLNRLKINPQSKNIIHPGKTSSFLTKV
jgi:hypothetical protein